MPRADEEELLEPILPKHPPYQREGEPAPATEPDDGVGVAAAPGAVIAGRPWERWVLVGCAVVAALSLVVVALRVSEIAEHERVQTCQARAFAEQTSDRFSGRADQDDFARGLRECVGIEDPGAEDGED